MPPSLAPRSERGVGGWTRTGARRGSRALGELFATASAFSSLGAVFPVGKERGHGLASHVVPHQRGESHPLEFGKRRQDGGVQRQPFLMSITAELHVVWACLQVGEDQLARLCHRPLIVNGGLAWASLTGLVV